jgi:hypothetical protein
MPSKSHQTHNKSEVQTDWKYMREVGMYALISIGFGCRKSNRCGTFVLFSNYHTRRFLMLEQLNTNIDMLELKVIHHHDGPLFERENLENMMDYTLSSGAMGCVPITVELQNLFYELDWLKQHHLSKLDLPKIVDGADVYHIHKDGTIPRSFNMYAKTDFNIRLNI